MWASPTDVTYFIFPDAHTGTVSMTGVDLDSTIVPREISAAP